MANFPIKMLKDEQGQPFVPAVSADTISMTSGYSLQTEIDNKLEPENIIAGNNIKITKNDNDCVVNGPNIMNNVTTTQAGQGVLDAHQGKVLNDRITTLANTIDTNETDMEGKMTAVQNRVTELENSKVDKEVGKGLSTNDFTNELKTKLNGIESGAQVNTITGIKGGAETNYRTGNVDITKTNIGLGNVEDKSSATIRDEITSTNVTDALGFTPIDGATKGVPGGIAELGTDGKVPAAQLPSFVDDVEEFADKASFPATGENGKIYVALDTNLTYRWSGTSYIEISQSLALGETASTAYPGDKGAAAYAHAVANKGSAFASGLYKVTTNSEGHVTGAIAVQKKDITDLGIPSNDTTYNKASSTEDGLMSKEDKDKVDNLATVASSGSYNDLSDKPTIPTKTSQLTNDSSFTTTEQVDTIIAGKQDTLTAGDNIAIADNVISANIPIYFFENDGTTNGSDSWETDKNREIAEQVFNHCKNNEPYIVTGANGWFFDSISSFTTSTSTGQTVITLIMYFKKQRGGFSSTTGTSGKTYSVMTLRYFESSGTIRASIDEDFNIFSDSGMLCANSTYKYTPTNAYNPATKKYVDDSISAVPERFLGNYLTKDNTTEFIPTGDYNPSTKKYVDDKFSTMPTNLSAFTNDSGFITDTQLIATADTKQDVLTAGDNINLENNVISSNIPMYYFDGDTTSQKNKDILTELAQKVDNGEPFMFWYNKCVLTSVYKQGNDSYIFQFLDLDYANTDQYDVSYSIITRYRMIFNPTSQTINIYNHDLYLINDSGYRSIVAKDNTEQWTPTQNYGLVHKKYVDDLVKTSIGDALGGSY